MSATHISSRAVGERLPPTFEKAARATLSGFVSLLPGLLVLAGLSGCTWICFQLGVDLASVGFLYLVCVVLAAVYGGFRQATLVSVIAVGFLDLFFEEPIFSFTVGRLSNWVELGAFELTALIISQLSNRAHLRELEAVAERRDTARLYETARRILLFDSPGDPGNQVAPLIREMFGLRSVVLFDALSTTVYKSGDPEPGVEKRTYDAYCLDLEAFDPQKESWFCVLRLGGQPMGALALCGTEMKQLIAKGVASLAALTLERARMLERQCQAEAARQAEQLRTAVLDALAHKFKTPLTIISTANSGIPAAGDLSGLQRELVCLVDQEARKLNDLASRLVGAPKLDFEEFKPQPEPLLFSRLIKTAIQEIEQRAERERFQVLLPAWEPPVFADRELILTALAQLVDNSLKYSLPGSPIHISVAVKETSVVLKMRSKGLVVSAADLERIFERFYRSREAQHCSAGTGLGLSIVRTIANDHRGHVWAEAEPDYGTVFSFSLPVASDGVSCER